MRLSIGVADDGVALVRAAPADASLTLLVEPGRDPLSLALLRAAIGPLAVERAPARVNAVFPDADADPADVNTAAAWLDAAASTTGQLMEISARAESVRTPPATR